MFGIARQAVNDIRTEKRWKWLSVKKMKNNISDEDIVTKKEELKKIIDKNPEEFWEGGWFWNDTVFQLGVKYGILVAQMNGEEVSHGASNGDSEDFRQPVL
jgi:hypothetical protein